MIEMRYLEKTHLPEHDGATGFNYKVLQYRYRNSSAKYGNNQPMWSEWIDVPTVTAPTA
jgi:hypothetical protein